MKQCLWRLTVVPIAVYLLHTRYSLHGYTVAELATSSLLLFLLHVIITLKGRAGVTIPFYIYN
jgi:hypothetical protein